MAAFDPKAEISGRQDLWVLAMNGQPKAG